MSQDVINEHTDEEIKSYLTEKEKNSQEKKLTDNLSGNKNNRFGIKNNKKQVFAILFLAVVIVCAFAYSMYKKGQESFDVGNVSINIDVSSEVSSGEETSVTLEYKNDTNVKLKNANIALYIPEKFLFVSSDNDPQKEKTVLNWKIENIIAGQSGKVKLFGIIIGEKDTKHIFKAALSYIPDNFNSEFQSTSQKELTIMSVPFELSVKAPQNITPSDEIEYVVDYENASVDDFKSVEIKGYFSKEFQYSFSKPEITMQGENYLTWNIGEVKSGGSGQLIIKGEIIGVESKEMETIFALESSRNDSENRIEYTRQKVLTTIQENPVILSQIVNGSENYCASKGEELEYKIKFKNIGEKEIRNLVINSELEGQIDFSSLDVIDGSYDNKYKITWSAFNVPQLAELGPEEEGDVNFRVKIKDFINIENSADKNFVIKNKATINSFNFDSDSAKIGKTLSSSESTVRIKSSFLIRSKGYFNDDGRIINSGVIPPEVGKETTYTIHWDLRNLFNDVGNIKIISTLPEGVRWTGNYIGPDGKVSLGDETNGTFITETVDSNTISNINGGIGEDKLEVSYNWYNKTIRNNENDKGLPENLKEGNTLEFVYDDGNIREIGHCVIKEHPVYKEHDTSCLVPWKVSLSSYGEKDKYTIKKVMPKTGEEMFYYNIQTREIIWEIPKLNANTGVLSPSKEVVFQTSITPKETDVGEFLKILNETRAMGYDEFVNTTVEGIGDALTTELPDDESVGVEEGIVIKSSEIESEP